MRQPILREKEFKQKKGLTYGKYYPTQGVVQIDPRQPERDRFDTTIHEIIHHFEEEFGVDIGEERVVEMAKVLTKAMFDGEGYRRVK